MQINQPATGTELGLVMPDNLREQIAHQLASGAQVNDLVRESAMRTFYGLGPARQMGFRDLYQDSPCLTGQPHPGDRWYDCDAPCCSEIRLTALQASVMWLSAQMMFSFAFDLEGVSPDYLETLMPGVSQEYLQDPTCLVHLAHVMFVLTARIEFAAPLHPNSCIEEMVLALNFDLISKMEGLDLGDLEGLSQELCQDTYLMDALNAHCVSGAASVGMTWISSDPREWFAPFPKDVDVQRAQLRSAVK
jgi:hypothetical protein